MQPISPEQARGLREALTTMLVAHALQYLVPGKGVDMTALLGVIRRTLENHTAKPGTAEFCKLCTRWQHSTASGYFASHPRCAHPAGFDGVHCPVMGEPGLPLTESFGYPRSKEEEEKCP